MISDFGLIRLIVRMKLQRFARVAFWIARIADHEGKFRDDVELPDAARDVQGFFGGDVLLHLLQHPVGTGFRAEEDHRAAGAANRRQRRVGIFVDDVDARFAPPLQVQRRDAIGQLAGVIFAQKEIHVVELHRIGAVLRHQVAQDRFGARRALHALAIAVGRVDSAEAATERAADAGVMHGRALAEKRRPQIFLDRHLVERRPRKSVRALHQALGIVPMQAEDILVRQALNASRTCAVPRIASSSSSSVSSPWPRTT